MTLKQMLFLLSFGALLAACHPRQEVVIDNTKPYRLAEDTKVEVWVPIAEKSYVKASWQLREGDWCVTASAVQK